MASRGVSIAPGKPAVVADAYDDVAEDEEEIEEIEEVEEIEPDVGPPVLLADPWACDLLDREFVGSVLATANYVVVGTMTGKVIVLDSRGEFPVNSGQALRGHEGIVDDLSIDAKEEYVASISRVGTLLVQPIIRRESNAGFFEQKGSMPLSCVALHPDFAAEAEKPVVFAGSEGTVYLCTRGGFFGNVKKTALDTGCGPVAAVSWRGSYIVWVGTYICVYNYNTKTVIGHVPLPKTIDSPLTFGCRLFWETDRNFVLGWSNVVRAVAVDHDRPGPNALKVTNSFDASLADTPYRVLSIIAEDSDHFLLMITRECETTGNQKIWHVTAPVVVKTDRFGTWKDTPEQYVVCDRKQRPSNFLMAQSPDHADIFIVTPDRYLRARRATTADQIKHFMDRREWDRAYRLAQRNASSLDAALVEKCGVGMLMGLFTNGQHEDCARLLGTVLRRDDGEAWGAWIDRFEQVYRTHLLVDRLPHGPDLKPQVRPHYEIVMARELDRDIRAFRHAMVTLNNHFSIPPVLKKLRDRVAECKSTGATKDLECLCLAKLYEMTKDFSSAMRYHLEVQDRSFGEPYNFIRKHELWAETIQNLPSLMMHNADETLNILVEKRNVQVTSRDKRNNNDRDPGRALYASDVVSNASDDDDHHAVFDPIKVVQQLQTLVLGEKGNAYMWSYLSKLRLRNREAFEGVVKKFPVHVLDLHAEIEPSGLLAFMKEYECFVVAGAIQWSGKCKAKGFVEEHAFIEAKLGHREPALTYMFSELKSVSKAVMFIKEHFYSVPERKDMFQRIITEALNIDRTLESSNAGRLKYFEYEPRMRFETWRSIADKFAVQATDLLDLNSMQNINDPLPAASATTGRVVVRIPSKMIESLLSVLSQPSEEDESQWLDPIFLLQQLPESRKIVGLCDSLRRITNLSRAHYDMNKTLFLISQKDVFDTLDEVRIVRRSAIKFGQPLSFCDACQKPFESKGDDAVRFRACSHMFHHACVLAGVISDVHVDYQATVTPVAFLEDPWKYASVLKRGSPCFPACLLCDEPAQVDVGGKK